MEYIDEIVYLEKLFNVVCSELNQKSLLENEYFNIVTGSNYNHYIELDLNKKNAISLRLYLNSEAVTIDIDRASEGYVFDIEFIKNNEAYFINFIRMLFTSIIEVEYCGRYYTKIYFKNMEGKVLETLKYVTFFYWRKNCITKKYLPIFPHTSKVEIKT